MQRGVKEGMRGGKKENGTDFDPLLTYIGQRVTLRTEFLIDDYSTTVLLALSVGSEYFCTLLFLSFPLPKVQPTPAHTK